MTPNGYGVIPNWVAKDPGPNSGVFLPSMKRDRWYPVYTGAKLDVQTTPIVGAPPLPRELPIDEPPPAAVGLKEECPWHTRHIFNINTMPLVVRWAEAIIYKLEADAIVAVGHSGLILAGALSYVTRVPVFAVRKNGEESLTVAGSGMISAIAPNGPAKKWVWVDDFIGSGGTFRRAVKHLYKAGLIVSPAPAGLILYNNYKRNDGPEHVDGYTLKLKHGFPEVKFEQEYIPSFGFKE